MARGGVVLQATARVTGIDGNVGAGTGVELEGSTRNAAAASAAAGACAAYAVGTCIRLGRTWKAGSGAVCDGGTDTGAGNYGGVANTGALTCAGDAGLATG